MSEMERYSRYLFICLFVYVTFCYLNWPSMCRVMSLRQAPGKSSLVCLAGAAFV